MSASYRVNDNLKQSFEAINITDEPVVEYMDPSAERLISEFNTGAQYYLGATYRY